MKLYYAPGACSLAVHIVLRETKQDFELEKVDLASHTTAGGTDFNSINPKGYVPALELDDGEVLTEVAATLQYVADQNTESALIPATGRFQRYRVLEALNFVATEIHKTLGALFNPKVDGAWKQHQLDLFARRAAFIDATLGNQAGIAADSFSVADAYLFTVLGWTRLFDIDLQGWPNLIGYFERVAARPAVTAAMRAEGLLREAA